MPNYCPECGKKLEGNPKFCPECGAKIAENTITIPEREPKTSIENTLSKHQAPISKSKRKLAIVHFIVGIISMMFFIIFGCYILSNYIVLLGAFLYLISSVLLFLSCFILFKGKKSFGIATSGAISGIVGALLLSYWYVEASGMVLGRGNNSIEIGLNLLMVLIYLFLMVFTYWYGRD